MRAITTNMEMLPPFPLTPALSRREREERIPLPANRNATALRALTDFLPLPAGEGRGEGERRVVKQPRSFAPKTACVRPAHSSFGLSHSLVTGHCPLAIPAF